MIASCVDETDTCRILPLGPLAFLGYRAAELEGERCSRCSGDVC